MTDSQPGMEAPAHRIHKLIRTAVPAVAAAAAVAVAGCGGGGGSNSAEPPAPADKSSSAPGGVVSVEGTLGLVGPVGRATNESQQFEDRTAKISPKANRKPDALKNGVEGGEACNDGGLMPSDDNIAQLNAAILCLVNAERTANGNLPPLTENAELDRASAGMCTRMVTEHFFAHDTPDGKTVVDRIEPTGYIPNGGDWVVGENLAWGSGALSTPQSIVNGWMNSPGHKANILASDYKDIGLATCMGSPTTTYSGGTVYVNNFGAKSGANPNVTLPGHEPTAGQAATTAGAKAASHKAKKSKKKAKKKKRKRKHRRHARR
jgi:uncharacterized protein YkwD